MAHLDYIWTGLVIGAASFGHCLGMCGPFALHLARGHSRAANLGRQLLWHAGRTATYVFLGALAGFFGGLVASPQRPWAQKLLTYLAGGAMIAVGLAMLGLLPRRAKGSSGKASGAAEGLLTGLMRQFVAQPTAPGALVLGIVTGFLPCGIVWGALALSVQSRSVPAGMGMMAALGAGTVWALLILGLTGGLVKHALRRWGAGVAAAVLIVLGAATVLRGSELMRFVLPRSALPPAGATTAPSTTGAAGCH